MLEHPSLSVEPPGPSRAIFDAASGERLGRAVRVRRGLLRPSVTAVHEGPDDSLLAVAGRTRWFGPVVVTDAEGQAVATVRGGVVVGPDGAFLARRTGRSFVNTKAIPLATWTRGGDRITLRFTEPTDGQPLLRMALLAAALLD
jgi:hypothetical protein